MKNNPLLSIFISAITIISFSAFYSGNSGVQIHGQGGQASSTGSPGEPGTCSRSGCHGAGNGGLADNAGPGSVTITPTPAFINGNQYVAGQTYTMTVTVSETGKPRFGFACEILDNSGNTNTHVNNTAGTISVLDHINTRTWQAFATGRLAVTQDTNGGFSNNTASFIFAWTAPLSFSPSYGTVNLYLCGNAADGNLIADGPDNIYTLNKQLTPSVTGIQPTDGLFSSMQVYPVPATDKITLELNSKDESDMTADIFSLEGKLVKHLDNRKLNGSAFTKSYSLDGIEKGCYLLQVGNGKEKVSKKIIIR